MHGTANSMPAGEADNGRSPEDIAKWQTLRLAVEDIKLAESTTLADLGRRIGIANGTFNQWFNGTYTSRLDTHNAKVANWLEARTKPAARVEIAASPSFLPTSVSAEMIEVFILAQRAPGLCLVHGAAGVGKTMAAEHYRSTGSNVHIVTMNEKTRTVDGMLGEIAEALDMVQTRAATLSQQIRKRLARRGDGTLLILDEAQHLSDEAVNQARHFVDKARCGVVLLGNEESYGRLDGWIGNGGGGRGGQAGRTYAQLSRRVFMRMQTARVPEADIRLFARAWGITDEDSIRVLVGIGAKPGALGQVDMTCRLARLIATDNGRGAPTRADLEKAWSKRGTTGAGK